MTTLSPPNPDKQNGKETRPIGTTRVEIRNLEKVHHEARSGEFSFQIDEPPERGGTNKGLHPLGYFVTGAASCFLTQLSKVSMTKGYNVEGLEITARAHYDTSVSRQFTDIVYDVRMTGKLGREEAMILLHDAEKMCFVHQTLKHVIPLTSNLSLNGEFVISSAVGP